MSEYHRVSIEFLDEECLVAALEAMGYEPIWSDEPISLKGYQGDTRAQKAHIVLPRRQVGSASNDIGLERTEDGFALHISEYDRNGPHRNFQNLLQQHYAQQVVVKEVKSNYRYGSMEEEIDEDGNIVLTINMKDF